MTKHDARIERMVGEAAGEYYGTNTTFGEVVTKLLRRESAYQRARMRRIVNRAIMQAELDHRNSGQGQIHGMYAARILRHVLAALRGGI